jgi:hypothetical protein
MRAGDTKKVEIPTKVPTAFCESHANIAAGAAGQSASPPTTFGAKDREADGKRRRPPAKTALPQNGMRISSSLSAGDRFSSAEPSDKTNNENA